MAAPDHMGVHRPRASGDAHCEKRGCPDAGSLPSGLHYLEIGYAKEARYYFGEISRRPGPSPAGPDDGPGPGCNRQWGLGRRSGTTHRVVASWAPEIGVLEGLAVVSPPPASHRKGRQARSRGRRGPSRGAASAAELLQRDGYIAESRPIPRGWGSTSVAACGNGWPYASRCAFLDGDTPEAVRAWQETQSDLLEIRLKMTEMLHGDPSEWPTSIPALVQLSIPRTDAGAEALYLLAQVDESLLVVSRKTPSSTSPGS